MQDQAETSASEETTPVSVGQELAVVFDHLPVGTVLVDQDRRVRRANLVALEMAERKAEEIVGLLGGEALRCIHALDDPRGCGFGPSCEACAIRLAVLDTLDTGSHHARVETVFRFRRGGKETCKHLLISTIPLEISGGQYVLVSFEDITERRNAEAGRENALAETLEMAQALRESETRFRDLYENAPNAYFSVGTDGLIHRCNRRAGDLLGYTAKDLVGKPVFDLYADTPHGKERATVVFQRFLGGKAIADEDLQMQRADGTPVWVSLTVNAVRDADGQIVESRSVVVDITERKQAEEALQLQMAQMEALRQVGLEVAAQLDLHPLLHSIVSRAMELVRGTIGGLFLYRPERELLEIALNVGDTAIPVDITMRRGEGLSGRVWETGEPLIVDDYKEWPYRAFDSPIAHTLIGVPIRWGPPGGDVEFLGVLTIGANVPHSFSENEAMVLELFATEAALAIRNARLYEQALQATEALRQRTAELQVRNEELDAFAHTVAHDLKAPLASVMGYIEVLEKLHSELPDEQMQEYLHSVAQAGRRMNNIIDELLLLASVRKAEVEVTVLEMSGIVSRVLESLGFLIEEHEAEIVLPDAWPQARGHGPWVEEVWANYISNALKYGGRPPRVELGATEQADSFVRFWVRDNGPGLAPVDQKHLFTPFTQLNRVRAEGQGLGLSIVRRIVTKLGGQVAVESQKDKGSVFSFTLPAS